MDAQEEANMHYQVQGQQSHDVLQHFMLPSIDKLYGDADFHFPSELDISPHCLKYQKNGLIHSITVLNRAVNFPESNFLDNLQSIVKWKT